MHPRKVLRASLVFAALVASQACATKGFVREQIAASRVQSDSAIASERAARIQADNEQTARLIALRGELDSLRTQFGAKIAFVEDGIRFLMPVTFAFDDATVTSHDRPQLERFARVAQRYYPNATITVEGFADPAGSDRYNLALSRRRAENVGQTLASLGVPSTQLRTVGYGETRLIAPRATHNERGAEQNRRVVFVIETGAAEAAMVASLP